MTNQNSLKLGVQVANLKGPKAAGQALYQGLQLFRPVSFKVIILNILNDLMCTNIFHISGYQYILTLYHIKFTIRRFVYQHCCQIFVKVSID